MDTMIGDLQTLIRQPSISTKSYGLIECAEFIKGILNKAGVQAELLYQVSRTDSNEANAPPLVFGHVRSKNNPNSSTLLFYNHYDVQPDFKVLVITKKH